MRSLATSALAATLCVLAGCGPRLAAAPDGDEHGYLLFEPPSQEAGWAVVDALNHDLSAADKDKVRTAGLVSGDKPTMFVDFTGNCARDVDFLAAARRIAARHGQTQVTCSTSQPGLS